MKKKLLSHWKLIVASLVVLLIAGIGSYFYFSYQGKELDHVTQSVQNTAINAMKKKETQQKKDKNNKSNGVDKPLKNQKDQIKMSDPENKAVEADYIGKDVKPLSLKSMNKVNAEKVVSNFGVGTIEIPSISMNLPILEGISQNNLSVGAGTMKPNQVLGKGNFSLAGHYMTNAGLLFGGIKNVKKDDPVKITYKNKTVIFKVIKVKHITASDNQVIYDSEGEGILSLITCDHSVAGTKGRILVRAAIVR